MDNEIKKDGTQSNLSSKRLLRIIEYLAQQETPVRLLDISKDLNINSSTVLRFLTTLIDTGYARQELESARYQLTYKICTLGNKVSSRITLRDIAAPYMRELKTLFDEVICLAVEQEHKVVYIDIIENNSKMLQTTQRIGHVAPLHCTGIGKLLLLNYSDAELDELIRETGLQKFTEKTITSKEQLVNELDAIRLNGYACDDEECELGARCVSFPIYDMKGNIIAGISVTGPTTRMSFKEVQLKLPSAIEIVKRLSAELGYTG